MITLQNCIDAIESLATALEYTGSLILVASLFYLSLRYGKWTLYIIAGLTTLFVNISVANHFPDVAYGICVISAYQFIKGIQLFFEGMGQAKGWSQFSGLFRSIKDWF